MVKDESNGVMAKNVCYNWYTISFKRKKFCKNIRNICDLCDWEKTGLEIGKLDNNYCIWDKKDLNKKIIVDCDNC